MIKANHKRFYVWLLSFYATFIIDIFFRKIRYIGEDPSDKSLPVLMIANHFSWWDGFIQTRLNLKVFRKKFYFMMLEDELAKEMMLNKAGATSIAKGSRSIIESLKYLIEVIQKPENLFLLFPQGKIQSIYSYPYKFEKGALNYIVKNTTNEFQFIFNVNLIDYAAHSRPELSVYYKTYHMTDATTAEDIENDYNEFANACMTKQRSE